MPRDLRGPQSPPPGTATAVSGALNTESAHPRGAKDIPNPFFSSLLEQLSDRVSIERLDKLIASLDDAPSTLDQVRIEEQRLCNADSGQEQQQLKRQAAKLEALHQHIERIHALLSHDGLVNLQVARNKLRQSQEATTQLAQAFASEPLPGVGSSSWQILWDAAQRFSVEQAYPDRLFPFVEDKSRCVLCQQTLESEGRARLRRFEEFVKEDTQVQFEEARKAYGSLEEELAHTRISTEAVENHLSDLESDHADLMRECKALFSRYQQSQKNALNTLSDTETLTLSNIDRQVFWLD